MKSEEVEVITEVPKVPCSVPPEEVLERFANELRHPINSIKGCVAMLQDPAFQDQHQEIAAQAYRMTEWMEKLCAAVKDYLHECFDR
jgi:hypothetical protein